MKKKLINLTMLVSFALASDIAGATPPTSNFASCRSLINSAAESLHTALTAAQQASNGGFGFNMWGAIVNRDGVVCAVAYTGSDRGAQWPGSRLISAQKAYTANAFSLPNVALSTANLYTAVQPGGSLYGLQASNPINTDAAYAGSPSDFGTAHDPLVGELIGGINVFGGGLALYNSSHQIVGAIGVSGDTSCADHNIAWRTRNNLGLDHVPHATYNASGDATHPDNIVYDITSPTDLMPGVSAGGWGHPLCNTTEIPSLQTIASGLPVVTP